MYFAGMKKRWIVVLLFVLLLCASVQAKRVFKGSASIQAGSYEDFFLRVVTSEKVIYVEPGETTTFNMYVRRSVSEKIAHDVVISGNDDRFILTIEPTIIPELHHTDMVRLKASLYVPQDAEPDTYPLRIKVKGKEFVEESYPTDTVLKVGPHSNLPNYLFLLFAAMLVAWLVWRTMHIKRK